MKGNEILVLAGVILENNESGYERLGKILRLSPSQVFNATNSLSHRKLIKKTKYNNTVKFEPLKTNCFEFFIHCLKYVFPLKIQAKAFGIQTLNINDKTVNLYGTDIYVWPYEKGDVFGTAIVPIHKNIPVLSLKKMGYYNFFIALDMLRSGNPRNVKEGIKYISKVLGLKNE